MSLSGQSRLSLDWKNEFQFFRLGTLVNKTGLDTLVNKTGLDTLLKKTGLGRFVKKTGLGRCVKKAEVWAGMLNKAGLLNKTGFKQV